MNTYLEEKLVGKAFIYFMYNYTKVSCGNIKFFNYIGLPYGENDRVL